MSPHPEILRCCRGPCGRVGRHPRRPPRRPRVTLPPTHAGFDYQIGGAYTPAGRGPASSAATGRAAPAAGLYNICYVNAFQAQPGEREPVGLPTCCCATPTARSSSTRTGARRCSTSARRPSASGSPRKVNGWIDGCATKGYQAIEPDNYDSYTRSEKLLTAGDATGVHHPARPRHAHAEGLAIGAEEHRRAGRDSRRGPGSTSRSRRSAASTTSAATTRRRSATT